MVSKDDTLGPFFQLGVLCRRLFLAYSAVGHVKHLKLMAAHLTLFYLCSLHKAFQLLDKETDPYGETPYRTLDKVAKRFRVLAGDVLYDLGSGRGLGAFWWALRVKCRVVGVERCPPLVTRAKQMQSLFSIPRVSFIEEDFLTVDLSHATVIYLYGTALSDEMIARLLLRFAPLGRHVKIISVSYPLADYSADFVTVDQCTGMMPWGTTDFYLNQIVSSRK